MSALSQWYPAHALYQKWKRFAHASRYHAIVKKHRLPLWDATPLERLANEIAYADILRQMTASYGWLPSPLYTVGGAASHGLVYALARALEEYRFSHILELGVGQSTAVLSAYAQTHGATVLSLEENADWAAKLRERHGSASHQIIHAPLVPGARGASWYDPASWREHVPAGGFDLILVDGPVGTKTLSRSGVVAHFKGIRAAEWAVIWDDLDRAADLESFALFTNAARSEGESFGTAFCSGKKVVGFTYTRKFGGLGHYA